MKLKTTAALPQDQLSQGFPSLEHIKHPPSASFPALPAPARQPTSTARGDQEENRISEELAARRSTGVTPAEHAAVAAGRRQPLPRREPSCATCQHGGPAASS